MSTQQTIFKLVQSLSGQSNILTIPRLFIHLTGDIKAALFLSQCLYWSDKTKHADGTFYKTYEEWELETGLSRTEILSAREKCKQFVAVEIHRADGSPTMHFRVDSSAVADALESLPVLQETCKSICRKPANPNAENLQMEMQETCKTLTETTTETTTDIPTSSGGSSVRSSHKMHPALGAYFKATGYSMIKAMREKVIAVVGEDPQNVERWYSTVEAWVGQGYNPRAIDNMLEVYRSGGSLHNDTRKAGREDKQWQI